MSLCTLTLYFKQNSSFVIVGFRHSVRWFEIDDLGLIISPIFKVKSVTLEDGTDRQYQNVGIKPPYAA